MVSLSVVSLSIEFVWSLLEISDHLVLSYLHSHLWIQCDARPLPHSQLDSVGRMVSARQSLVREEAGWFPILLRGFWYCSTGVCACMREGARARVRACERASERACMRGRRRFSW